MEYIANQLMNKILNVKSVEVIIKNNILEPKLISILENGFIKKKRNDFI